jgi:hypothetical protein
MNKKRYLIIVGIVGAVALALLAILLYTVLGSHQPTIASLKAEPQGVLPRGTSLIVCTAVHPDGDELIYGWSASGGTISGEGASVSWTAPGSAGSYNVTVVVVDSRGAAVSDFVTITVRTNKAPVIGNLAADADWIVPSGTLSVTCSATDPNGDELSYEWSATGGEISGTGAEVTWTAPEQAGTYYLTVVVTDTYGGSATRVLPIGVATGQPPTIETLLITKDRFGHCYLKPYSGGYYVGKEQMYDIECIVSNTSGEVSYEWSCDGGEISETSEDGSMITWTAPSASSEVTITVIVSDAHDNEAGKTLVLTVVSCSTCTFGSCSG